MFFIKRFFLFTIMYTTLHFIGHAQKIEAAYSEWDNQLDEWKIHVNEEEYVLAIKQFGTNPYNRWNLTYEGEESTWGHMQTKWSADFNYIEFFLGNEQINITTVYPNDPTVWRITHGETSMVIQRQTPFEWRIRNKKDFDWIMYEVEEGVLHDWYIDDYSGDDITFEMRVAAVLIVLESMLYIF